MAADEEVVCPKVELLTEIATNIPCSVAGCSKILPNSSSLRMHLVKTHNVIANVEENKMFGRNLCENKNRKKTLYCCPVDGCVRGRNSGRHFSRLAHVKQHYMTIHGEKKYTCKICDKKFGRNDACLRHEKSCGKVFPCSCGCPFNSITSMFNHARRNGHEVPNTDPINGFVPNPIQGSSICYSILPIVNKGLTAFRPLRPKKLLVNTETQTEEPDTCINNSTSQLVQNDKSFSVNLELPTPVLSAICEYTQTTDGAYTQTNDGYGQTVHKANTQTMDEAHTQTSNDYSQTIEKVYIQTMDEAYTQTTDGAYTQTNDAYGQTVCKANTQTMDEAHTQTNNDYSQTIEKAYIQTMDEAYTQTIGNNIQTMDEAYTQTSFITEGQFDMDFSIDNEELKELAHSQTQTNFGLVFDGFPLFEDNETQTLESYLELDPSNITSDCATQTKDIFDEIFSVDTQTQTLLPLINFEEQFESHCSNVMNHQTQTLESIYLDSQT